MKRLVLLIAVILTIGCVTQMDSSISLSTNPTQPIVGQPTTLSFSLLEDGKPLQLQTHHERKIHTVIISENFNVFGHVHPEDFGKENEVQFTFPHEGKYGIAIDFMANNMPDNKLFSVQVNGSSLLESTITNSQTQRCFTSYPEEGKDKYTKPFILSQAEVVCPEGYPVTFSYNPTLSVVSYHFMKDGSPIVFDPYLGEVMHLAIVDEGFKKIIHTHGIATESGMYQSIPLSLGIPGKYYIFSQSKVNGNIIVTRFEFTVSQKNSGDMPSQHEQHMGH